MLRKARLAVSISMVAGVIGAAAPAANASPGLPGLNYGHCVSAGIVDPATDGIGPLGVNSNTPTGETGAINAFLLSGGNGGDGSAAACTPS